MQAKKKKLGVSNNFWIIGIPYANVFPLPVSAKPIISFPCNA
jgi:hypothetical protein